MAYLKTERRGAVLIVTISRPEALGALNAAMLAELKALLDAVSADDGVRAVVLTGEGKAFVAGADISEMYRLSPDEAADYARRGAAVLAAVECLPQPVIAAVNGYALGGGCELALACDVRVASETARFGQPEVGLGVIPGYGGTQRLARLVGSSRAMEMILTGKPIDATGALSAGLVNAVYPSETLVGAAVGLAEIIARNAPLAVRAAKRAVREGLDKPLAEGFAGETALFARCFATADQREGMAAFIEKRKAMPFEGK